MIKNFALLCFFEKILALNFALLLKFQIFTFLCFEIKSKAKIGYFSKNQNPIFYGLTRLSLFLRASGILKMRSYSKKRGVFYRRTSAVELKEEPRRKSAAELKSTSTYENYLADVLSRLGYNEDGTIPKLVL